MYFKSGRRHVTVSNTGNTVDVFIHHYDEEGEAQKTFHYKANRNAPASHKARRARRGFRLLAAALKQAMEQPS